MQLVVKTFSIVLVLLSSQVSAQDAVRVDGDKNWVQYVYARAFDCLIRDSRLAVHTDGYPMRDGFINKIRTVKVLKTLDSTLQKWLPIDSLVHGMRCLRVQEEFDKVEFSRFGLLCNIERVDSIVDSVGLNMVSCVFSDLFEKSGFIYLRVDINYSVSEEPFPYTSGAIFKIELCGGNFVIFREGIVPYGLFDRKNIYRVVQFFDSGCD